MKKNTFKKLSRSQEDRLAELGATVFSCDEARPDHAMDKAKTTKLIIKALNQLDERENTIIDLYCGLTTEQPMDYRSIGSVMSLSAERVRQLKVKAIDKMRKYLAKQTA